MGMAYGLLAKKPPEKMISELRLPPGKLLHNYGTSPFSVGKSTLNHHFQVRKLSVDITRPGTQWEASEKPVINCQTSTTHCVPLIWVNYNDLTATSLEIMVSKGNHPQMALIQVSEIL